MVNSDAFKYGAVMSLLKARRSLAFELKNFRACTSDSLYENELWRQFEVRLQEIEIYEDMIPEDLAALIMTHVLHSMEVTLWHR